MNTRKDRTVRVDRSIPKSTRLLMTCLPLLFLQTSVVPIAHPDGSILAPPKGCAVAIVVFEDLQCTGCAKAAPALDEVASREKVPLVRHDFPASYHGWATKAAVYARFFDGRSKKLGNEFRRYIFAEQLRITPETLTAVVAQFATSHGIQMPFPIDRDGRFLRQVQRDTELAQRIGVSHTPAVFVVSANSDSSVVEVDDAEDLSRVVTEKKAQAIGHK